ncbi:MAG TPA: hypothetical protein VIU46_00390 [Gallionellaceae bacterium]
MIETLTLITISLIALIIFRPGKTPPLENPLVINRIGQFHAVLAPRINLAQPLLENISRRVTEEVRAGANTPPLYFKVQDKEVKAHGQDCYLLAATLRDGVLYFQATAPGSNQNELDTIRAFSEAELSRNPETRARADQASASLIDAIHAAASQRGASLTALQ